MTELTIMDLKTLIIIARKKYIEFGRGLQPSGDHIGAWNEHKDFNMAAWKHTFVLLPLFNTTTSRILLFGSQKSASHFGFVRKLATETNKSLETDQGLQETKSTEQPQQSSKAHDKTREFLERNGIRVKKIRSQIDVSRLSVKKIAQILKFLDEIGIDREHRHKIVTNRPTILTTKEDVLRNRVQTMRNIGIFPESVAYVIKEAPGVLTARTEETLPEKVRRHI